VCVRARASCVGVSVCVCYVCRCVRACVRLCVSVSVSVYASVVQILVARLFDVRSNLARGYQSVLLPLGPPRLALLHCGDCLSSLSLSLSLSPVLYYSIYLAFRYSILSRQYLQSFTTVHACRWASRCLLLQYLHNP
jgi:hypothetical protein